MKDAPKAVWSIPHVSVVFSPSLKHFSIAYRSFKVSSRQYCIFEIHQLWQSGFRGVYSNCSCICSLEPEIIKIGQSSHKMYSNNIVNFQESTTILNSYTKKSGNLLKVSCMYIYIYIYILLLAIFCDVFSSIDSNRRDELSTYLTELLTTCFWFMRFFRPPLLKAAFDPCSILWLALLYVEVAHKIFFFQCILLSESPAQNKTSFIDFKSHSTGYGSKGKKSPLHFFKF